MARNKHAGNRVQSIPPKKTPGTGKKVIHVMKAKNVAKYVLSFPIRILLMVAYTLTLILNRSAVFLISLINRAAIKILRIADKTAAKIITWTNR